MESRKRKHSDLSTTREKKKTSDSLANDTLYNTIKGIIREQDSSRHKSHHRDKVSSTSKLFRLLDNEESHWSEKYQDYFHRNIPFKTDCKAQFVALYLLYTLDSRAHNQHKKILRNLLDHLEFHAGKPWVHYYLCSLPIYI